MNILQIFSTPIWQSEYPEFEENKEIFIKKIKEYQEENSSVKETNIFGYQSPKTLQLIPDLSPLFEYICQLAYKSIQDLDFVECDVAITSAWININDSKQCMNLPHLGKEVFTGIIYLCAPEKSGSFCIKNPSINPMWSGIELSKEKNEFTAENVRIDPVEGNIIFFPSYIPHFVEPNDHDEETISISFNVIAIPR